MQASHNKLIHLGLKVIPRRSTFAEANASRNSAFFEQLYHRLYKHYYSTLPDSRKPSLESRLFLMDSTTITLFTDVIKGAGCPAANGRKKGGAKAHVLLSAAQDVPVFIKLTEGARNDRVFMPEIKLPPGSILVFDKGYHNFARWQQWTDQKINWVTRLIGTEMVEIIENRSVSDQEKKKGVCSDARIILGKASNNSSTVRITVRLVTYKDPVSGKIFEFLTNNFRFNASTVAGLYRKRWQVELFFKRLKQNSPLRFFLGDNENAIKIQIWCAFIADLLVKIVKERLKKKWSFANLSALIKHHLMNYLHLFNFLNNPDNIQISITRNLAIPELFDS
jgi:hypothetical protein